IGRCNDSTNTISMALTAPLTKRIDATWSVGTGNGGLASGAVLSTDTTYHLFVVRVGNIIDVMFDTSVTCANGVANNAVLNYRRIASVMRATNLREYIQFGDYFFHKEMPGDIFLLTPPETGTLRAVTVPTGINVVAFGYGTGFFVTGATTLWILITSP